jgi:hypothetical protein
VPPVPSEQPTQQWPAVPPEQPTQQWQAVPPEQPTQQWQAVPSEQPTQQWSALPPEQPTQQWSALPPELPTQEWSTPPEQPWSALPPEQPWSTPPPGEPAPAGRGGFDPAAVKPMDWGIMIAGVLALIFSTFDYYSATAKAAGNSASDSISAWHGFFGWFAALLALAAAVVLAVHIFAPSAQLPIPVRLTVLGGFLLSTLCIVIAGFVTPGAKSSAALSAALGFKVTIDYGRGAGYFLSLIVILAAAVLSFLRLRETGGALPWEKSQPSA